MKVALRNETNPEITACQRVSDKLQDGNVVESKGSFVNRVFSSKNHFYKITPLQGSNRLVFPKERIALEYVNDVLPEFASHLIPDVAMIGEIENEIG